MRRAALALCLVVIAGCANRAKRSVTLYDAGDFAGAARAADEGLAAHPGDSGLWQMRIRSALALGEATGLYASYQAYRKQSGGDDHALLRDLANATLGQALASPSVKLKLAAIEAVAAAEIQALAEQVAERMGDDDDRVAAAAAVAVLRGFPQAPQVAGDMLRSENAEARRIAVDGIGRKVGALARADLTAAVEDPDPRVRSAAIRWLGQAKDKASAALIERQLTHSDDGVRAAAVTALARIGTLDAAALGVRAIRDAALPVRLAGVEVLRAAKRRAELAALASDPEPMVALEAAIGAADPALAARALDRAAADAKWTNRAGAANLAVRAVGKSRAAAVAARLAADPEIGVRLAAARLLVDLGNRAAAIAIFHEALKRAPSDGETVSAEGDESLAAAIDLAQLGEDSSLDQIMREATLAPDRVAAAASGHLVAHRITPGLVAALAHQSGVVRVAAAAALVILARS